MKHFFNISLIALWAIAFAGCEYGSNLGGNNGGSEEIEIPLTGDYISFWTDIETRAELITSNYIEDSFGVISYKYDPTNSWGAYKVSAVPYVDALGAGSDYPKEIKYENGTYSYGNPVVWDSEKYAFFAYAPYDHGKVDPSHRDNKGVPYVTYTLDTTNAKNHADVVTGYAVNCTAAFSKYVTFRMEHRLSAVDVAAVNYYDYSYESGSYDSEGQPIYTTEKVTIEIQEITAKFSNLQYGEAKIYLDNNVATVPTKLADGIVPTYPIVEGGYELKPSTSSEFDYISVEQGTTMLFIPQVDDPKKDNDNLIVDIEVKYKKRRPGGGTNPYLWTVVETVEELDEHNNTVYREYKVDIPAGSAKEYIETIDPYPDPNATSKITVLGCNRDEHGNYIDGVFTTTQIATFDQSLQEHFRYYALLTFTSHAVSINILTAAAWNEKVVDYEFD